MLTFSVCYLRPVKDRPTKYFNAVTTVPRELCLRVTSVSVGYRSKYPETSVLYCINKVKKQYF